MSKNTAPNRDFFSFCHGDKNNLRFKTLTKGEKMRSFLLKNWKIGAYFGSIALAVTIGMFQTTAREGISFGGVECIHIVTSKQCPNGVGFTCGRYDTCKTKIDAPKGADECDTAANVRCYVPGIELCDNPNKKKNHAGLIYKDCIISSSE
ncbi:MAG: hypothetical protein LBP59_09150 [Planctomycetaceae bacterium]|jgi:hypothetical protein|nr:hypothetical protein [Planctomycetaceae bacterium]